MGVMALLGSGVMTAMVASSANAQEAWAVTDQADASIGGFSAIACPTPSECLAVAWGANGALLETTKGPRHVNTRVVS
jgi:hypothetical protein